MVGCKRHRLDSDVDVSVLRALREEGMTNKQIANYVGCSISTVYNYIGKRSMDVRKAEEQNKPCPVAAFDHRNSEVIGKVESIDKTDGGLKVTVRTAVPEPYFDPPVPPEEISNMIEPKQEDIPMNEATPLLKVVREVRILDLDGCLCGYHVDPCSGDVTFRGDIISGMLDRQSLDTFIQELTEIKKMLEVV